MKTSSGSKVTGRPKSRKQKKAKSLSLARIGERYRELRRLRERIAEAESRLYAR
jgi:hypothetical protein